MIVIAIELLLLYKYLFLFFKYDTNYKVPIYARTVSNYVKLHLVIVYGKARIPIIPFWKKKGFLKVYTYYFLRLEWIRAERFPVNIWVKLF